jgi:DNA-binding HxlR family transcriptional regulator
VQVNTRRADGDHRSSCPINLSLEVIGDTWSLLVIRDLMFGNARHFRELLRSEEGISSGILADRLKRLTANGLISASDDPTHKQKTLYSLTEMGIALVPVVVQLGVWGRTYLPASQEMTVRIDVLERGGPAMLSQFMDELRHIHLGRPTRKPADPAAPTVLEQLDDAYNALVSAR